MKRQAGAREWLGFSVLAAPTLLVSVDVSVMLLALPHISAGLGADSVQTLWIMDMYGFMLAGFLITMGTLGDRIGRRKLLMIGATGFGAASLAAAFSTSPLMLIAARGALGIAGATLSPSVLALISNLFRDPKQRAFAISLWLVCFMGGMAAGPIVGGTLLEHFWWGSVFLLGIPVMLVLLVAAPFLLPEYRDPNPGRLDLVSVALSLAMILPVIYGLKETAKDGLHTVPMVAILFGLAVGTMFIRRQRTLEHPLVEVRLFTNRGFNAALGGMFGVTLTGANMLFITQHLQFIEELSPLHAGLWMLPAVCASIAGFLLSPILARRVRPAYLIAPGLLVSACGALLFGQVAATPTLLPLVLGFALFNVGAAPLVSLATDLVVGSVGPERAGSAAALVETSGEFAFAFGIATLGSLGTAVYRSELGAGMPANVPSNVIEAARDTLAGALTGATTLSDPLASVLQASARHAFVSGMHTVAGVTLVLFVVIAAIELTMLRQVRPIGSTATGDVAEPECPGTPCAVYAA